MVNLAAVLRRVCTPKAGSGKLDVGVEIYKQWQKGGQPRKELLNLLAKNGGDKDPLGFGSCSNLFNVAISFHKKTFNQL